MRLLSFLFLTLSLFVLASERAFSLCPLGGAYYEVLDWSPEGDSVLIKLNSNGPHGSTTLFLVMDNLGHSFRAISQKEARRKIPVSACLKCPVAEMRKPTPLADKSPVHLNDLIFSVSGEMLKIAANGSAQSLTPQPEGIRVPAGFLASVSLSRNSHLLVLTLAFVCGEELHIFGRDSGPHAKFRELPPPINETDP